MRPAPLIVAFALVGPLLAALAPAAQAHVEAFSEADTLRVGPYSVFLDPRPYPIYDGSALSLSAIATDTRTGRYATDVGMLVNVTAPNGASRTVTLRPDQTGYLVGALVVNEPGNHSARVLIHDSNGTHAGETWFDVYPDLAWRIRPSNANYDAYANETGTLEFETIDSRTYLPAGGLADLTVRVEHWTDDHRTMLGADETPMEQTSPGLWRASYRFPGTGMYHMRFASVAGNFTFSDVPVLHVTAYEREDEGSQETPGASALLAGLAAAALLAYARRSR